MLPDVPNVVIPRCFSTAMTLSRDGRVSVCVCRGSQSFMMSNYEFCQRTLHAIAGQAISHPGHGAHFLSHRLPVDIVRHEDLHRGHQGNQVQSTVCSPGIRCGRNRPPAHVSTRRRRENDTTDQELRAKTALACENTRREAHLGMERVRAEYILKLSVTSYNRFTPGSPVRNSTALCFS